MQLIPNHTPHSPRPLPERMQHLIQGWETTGDRRAIFLACYALMTRNMLTAQEQGRFEDHAWVGAMIHNFAEYYFVALDAYDHQVAALPEVWRQAHDLARAPTTPVVQSLLMGVNAHINHDLILVIADMLQDDWATMPTELRARRYRDHCMVNMVIGETIDTVQECVIEPYARLMELVDLLCGPLDEWCTARLIRNWRDDVWRSALTIVETPDTEARLALRRAMDEQALRRVRLLIEGGAVGARVFGYPLRWLNRLRLV